MRYQEIYSGVDLVYYRNQGQLEYDFIVAPSADPHLIQFEVRGARSVSRDRFGDLVVETADGEIRWRKPVVYQERDGIRHEIAANYVITDKGRVGFEVAEYDSRKSLFIDPVVYSTYLGGNSCSIGLAMAVDGSGNACDRNYRLRQLSNQGPVTVGECRLYRCFRNQDQCHRIGPGSFNLRWRKRG